MIIQSCVSWDDATAYASWLTQKTAKKYRLPSEAKWEYAARAGSSSLYHWGNDGAALCQFANVSDSALRRRGPFKYGGYVACDDGAAFTTNVGSYKPNGFGLFDIFGNAEEFTADCNNPDLSGTVGQDAVQQGACVFRVVRGGSWMSVRFAAFYRTGGNDAWSSKGFRVARDD